MNITIPAVTHNDFSIGTWLYAKLTHDAGRTQSSISQQCAELIVARNQIREVAHPLGVTIECLEGSVWVTLDGDSRDVVLDAGQSFTVDRNQRTLLMALEDARVRRIQSVVAQ